MDCLDSAAQHCLAATAPDDKRTRVRRMRDAWMAGDIQPTHGSTQPESATTVAGRPPRPVLVPPRELPRRRLGSTEGRAALLHAVAHIEFNAINLACDAVYRFRNMPRAYYDDWIRIADDEARHFHMVCRRLADCGFAYGDFPAHNGLWDMACKTADSCLARMALVPRVLEARGLDVTPGMIEKFRGVDDLATVAVLETILREEVPHVAAGTRWFNWCCECAGCKPEPTFRQLLAQHMDAPPKPPFNRPARMQAGFSSEELDQMEADA